MISSFLAFLISVTNDDTSALCEQLLRSVATIAKSLTIEIVISVFAMTFFHVGARTHNPQLMDVIRKAHCFDDPPPETPVHNRRLSRADDLQGIHEMFDLYADLRLRFSVTFNDKDEWMEYPIAVVACAVCENALDSLDDPSVREIPVVLRYFCAREGFSPEERFEVMKAMNEIISYLGPVLDKRFASDLEELFFSLKSDFSKMLEVMPTAPEARTGASLSLLQTESLSCIHQPTPVPSSVDYEPDLVYCTHFCPQKVRKEVRHSPVNDSRKPTGELVFEKVGTAVELGRGLRNATFRLYKDLVIIQERNRSRSIPTATVTHIWPRTKRNSGIEIVSESGDSILFDFLNVDVSTLIKTFKKANFEKCAVWPVSDLFSQLKCQEKWISGEISTFDYIMYLNYVSGRSFHDALAYPFFPSLLKDFDCREPHVSLKDELKVDVKARIRAAFMEPIVPAHFFFRIEMIDELPAWASSPATFVDEMRTLLESHADAGCLCSWFTHYFGPAGLTSNRRVLAEPVHLPRHLPSIRAVIPGQMDIPIINTTILAAGDRCSAFVVLLADGSLAHLSFTFSPTFNCELCQGLRGVNLDPDSTVVIGPSHIAILTTHELCFATSEELIVRPIFPEQRLISCLASQRVLYCDTSCSLGILSAAGKDHPFCQATSRIVNIAGDDAFKIAVVATIDGMVHVYNLLNGEHVRSAAVGGEVRKILITPNWGYILVLVQDAISVLSVNGELLTTARIADPISHWIAFSSRGADDLVAFVTDAGRLGQFRALLPDDPSLIGEVPDRTLALIFDRPNDSFVALSETGRVAVIPRRPPSLDIEA
jgi:hypothetical protein